MNTVRSIDGTTIAFDRSGEGPALILVDGALCFRAFGPMGGLVPLLAPHFTVFTYDRRGRGESGDASAQAAYAVEREVEDIEALIREAGGSAFVYGISSGAALALHAAVSGLNIRKLALYEPPFVVGAGDRRPPADSSKQLSKMAAEGRRGEAVAFFMTQMVGMPAEAVLPMRSAPMWPLLESVAPTLVYDATIMEDNNWAPPSRAAAVRIPTLVMVGGNSPAAMHQAVQSVADSIPGALCRLLEGQTHEVAAEAITPELIGFFAGEI